MGGLGELERAVMDAVWDAEGAVTAYDVQARLGQTQQRTWAVTTVLTVLGRLEKKGLVASDRSARPHHYRPVASRADHVAELMHEALGEATDRGGVLSRFVGGISAEDADMLRSLLRPEG
ncbi:MAG TPA: BlaI/MecI/CopY family transcriptional regulator [Ruania sp.]|nr:BlaI/MecI/CopY family transcriptional regulator [Ruania sp.]